jgi:hypothetical protein
MTYIDDITCKLCGKMMRGTTRGRKECGKCYIKKQQEKRKRKGLK